MSEMTSSSSSPSSAAAAAVPATAGKVLTDFSIKTIIEGQSNYEISSRQQQSANSNHRNKIHSNGPSTTRHKLIITSKEQQQLQQPQAQLQNPGSIHSNSVLSVADSISIRSRKYRPKNFQCHACKMAFSNNGQLKNHVRIHTGERPFRCEQADCKKTFTRNEELTRHKLIHTGDRPHSCTTCGKRFGRKDHLKKHVRTHDRKRLRKKVFVPARATYLEDDMFVPPKPARIINPDNDAREAAAAAAAAVGHTRLIDIASSSNLISLHNNDLTLTNPPHHMAPTPSIPSSVHPAHTSSSLTSSMGHCHPHHQLYHPAISTLATPAATTTTTTTTSTTSSAIQQLASDYWNKWYNLLGFYQHQYHYQPIDRLGALFR